MPFRIRSIRHALFAGFALLMLFLVAAGVIGWAAVRAGAHDVSGELTAVMTTSRQTAEYAGIITREMQAANSYLTDHDSLSLTEFRQLGRKAHALQRRFNVSQQSNSEEVAAIAAVDQRLSDVEDAYALAHRLSDLGRTQEARAQVIRTRGMVDALLQDLAGLERTRTAEVVSATERLDQQARWRAAAVLGAVAIAALLALLIALRTTRAIAGPLEVLTRHARLLSQGDLAARTETDLPGEFETLATAMNHATEALARLAEAASATADDVTHSAGDLASASHQISETANQVSEAVTQVSAGAETQVLQIQGVMRALDSIRDGTDTVASGAEEVHALAAAIEGEASGKRGELERTLQILFTVRTVVQQAAEEVRALTGAVGDINRFVVTVGRIADQTNLLALNAAIEAARAGQAGRGFGVVADEIRKLADQSRAAADEVVELTHSVTDRVTATSATMERGVAQVGEIERVSREIDDALAAILRAAGRTRGAADGVARTADVNVRVVKEAGESLSTVARTAEGHAATAMQVSASTEEQSVACEQMSAASDQLLRGSTQLRDLVGELKIA